jgi:hypothetical protein
MKKPMFDSEGRPYLRTHTCANEHPKHVWDQQVVLSAETRCLSGEVTVWCPICFKPAEYATAAFVVLGDGSKKMLGDQ